MVYLSPATVSIIPKSNLYSQKKQQFEVVLINLPHLSEVSLEQVQTELRKASLDGNLEKLIPKTGSKISCKHILKKSIEETKERAVPVYTWI